MGTNVDQVLFAEEVAPWEAAAVSKAGPVLMTAVPTPGIAAMAA